jgi:DNA-binding CsgD family transcriptional regulator
MARLGLSDRLRLKRIVTARLRVKRTVPEGCPLSYREWEALRCMALGLTGKEAASRMGLRYTSVGSHLTNVYAKLGVSNASGAVAVAFRQRWLSPDEQMPFRDYTTDDVGPRPSENWRPTAGQRVYLDCFERMLKNPCEETHQDMRRAWHLWLHEQAIFDDPHDRPHPPDSRRENDPLDSILSDVFGPSGPSANLQGE